MEPGVHCLGVLTPNWVAGRLTLAKDGVASGASNKAVLDASNAIEQPSRRPRRLIFCKPNLSDPEAIMRPGAH